LAKAEAAQPIGQLVKPDQLAGLAAYLLSPESGVMAGALEACEKIWLRLNSWVGLVFTM
jgi:hypothetical protein